MPAKTTQRLHSLPIAIESTNPISLTYNLDSDWFTIAPAHPEISFDYLPALIFSLQQIDQERRRKRRDSAIRREGE